MAPGFWRSVFSEPDGTPSFSRVATAVIVGFSMGWVTALVRLNHQLPDFGGLVLLIGALYGVNKVSAAVSARNGNDRFDDRRDDRRDDRPHG
jgi:hypothetical protein